MPRKEPIKPLFALRRDFVDSLDNVMQVSILMLQAVDMALRHGGLKPNAQASLQECRDRFHSAMFITGDQK